MAISRQSLPARGAWVETISRGARGAAVGRRSPQGERGLKHLYGGDLRHRRRRSPQGERGLKHDGRAHGGLGKLRRSPQGERGLKHDLAGGDSARAGGRSPQGERGLKPPLWWAYTDFPPSLPARGAWVETRSGSRPRRPTRVAPRKGSVG